MNNYTLIIEHNNSIPGLRGFSEYTREEVEEIGGIEKVVESLSTNGGIVYAVHLSDM